MNRIAVKFAASTLVLGLTMVSCRSDTATIRPESASAAGAEQQAGAAHVDARRALAAGDLARAVELLETAVALSPRDAGYRLLLADAYLKSGRFESARATYGDVIEIDPENVRASLSYALTQIALGRPAGAVAHLDRIAGRGAPADVGLAYALAGHPERGIALMEPAARTLTASPRLRQNLALAYAVAGNWQRARAVAEQDLSPAEVAPRLQEWASLTRPDVAGGKVAHLLGIAPVADSGQPAHLALRAPQAPALALAAAEPEPEPQSFGFAPVEYAGAPVPPPAAFSAAPVVIGSEIAEPEPAPLVFTPPAPAAAPEVRETSAPDPVRRRYADAAKSLLVADPAVVPAAMPAAAPPAPIFRRERPEPAGRRIVSADAGRYAVQIGAFSTPENAERAWIQAERRFGLRAEQPLTTTVELDGRVLHRVSVAGFDDRGSANRLCRSIKARGGECFVRGVAGDAPVRWAARYVRNG